MINVNMKAYNYYTLGALDAYGQPQTSKEPVGVVKIAINTTSQSIQDNINYKGATYIGLTHEKAINDRYIIDYGGTKLKVLYVNPTGRLAQVYLAEI
jgi:hypothetical protein